MLNGVQFRMRFLSKLAEQADGMADDRVLVVASEGWNHGVIGIVASKLVETYKSRYLLLVFAVIRRQVRRVVLVIFQQRMRYVLPTILSLRGGGHGAAAGVTLETAQIPAFRRRVNEFYDSLNLINQTSFCSRMPMLKLKILQK